MGSSVLDEQNTQLLCPPSLKSDRRERIQIGRFVPAADLNATLDSLAGRPWDTARIGLNQFGKLLLYISAWRGEAMDLLQLRVIERVLAVVVGGMSVYLGYRLFIKLPEQMDSSGKVVLPGGISVFVSRIGPGVFFSLFGAAVVVVSLQQGLELNLANKLASLRSRPRRLPI